jgi:hypothetical protein
LAWCDVKAVNHALLNHVDNDLKAHVPEASVQQVEDFHVRIVGRCQHCPVR